MGIYFQEKAVWGYKVATCIMLVSMISTYLVAYSSIIKLMLDQGTFEPAVIKNNTAVVICFKMIFLSFLGAFTMIVIEFVSTCMCLTQALAMMTTGMVGFEIVRKKYMWFFENMLLINEERKEGLKQ